VVDCFRESRYEEPEIVTSLSYTAGRFDLDLNNQSF